MGWRMKIHDVLEQHGPLRTGDLVAGLGFDVASTAVDVGTKFMDGLKPLHGSFCESQAQRVLGSMVDRGEVVWQRAANMDNWYRLPEQEFPVEAAPRERTLRQLTEEVFALLPREVVDDEDNEWRRNLADIEDGDAWVEFCPFVLTAHEDGWELADGDPICNWAGNTFEETYPLEVEGSVVAKRIKAHLVRYAEETAKP